MFRQVRYFSLLLSLLLAGCQAIDVPPTKPVAIPDSWQEKLVQDNTPVPLKQDWWKSADDPILNTLLEKIERQNLSIEQALFRLQAARAERAEKTYLPTAEVSANGGYDSSASTAGRLYSGLQYDRDDVVRFYPAADASWEIPIFGQYRVTQDIIKANTNAAIADIAAVRSAVKAEAVNNYIDLRTAQQHMLALQKIAHAQEKIIQLMQIRSTAGFADQNDLRNAELALTVTKAELLDSENQITQSKYELAKLVGETTIDQGLANFQPIPVFANPAFTDTPRDVVRHRPDVRKLEENILLAAAELKLAKSELYPQLILSGSLSPVALVPIGQNPNSLQTIGLLSLSMPLFDWGTRIAKTHRDSVRLAASASAYHEGVVGAVVEVEQRIIACRTAQEKLVLAKQAYKLSKKSMADAETLHQHGLNDEIDLAVAYVQHARAFRMFEDAAASRGKQLTALATALGGGVVMEADDAKQ